MHILKSLTFFLLLFTEATLIFSSVPVNASEGDGLFQQHCSRCHKSAERITTMPDKIATLLNSGSIRQHRFSLDNKTLQLIVEYIKQQK